MLTPILVPEITVMPSAINSDDQGQPLYRWTMRLHEESVLDSEDHGDDYASVAEALAQAYTVFADLVNTRKLYPANDEQEFVVSVKAR